VNTAQSICRIITMADETRNLQVNKVIELQEPFLWVVYNNMSSR